MSDPWPMYAMENSLHNSHKEHASMNQNRHCWVLGTIPFETKVTHIVPSVVRS
jgi:hypothetical protein